MKTITMEEHIERLRNRIRQAEREYYVDGFTSLTDEEFDALMRKLEELEEQFPEYITPESPTQRVGSSLTGKAEKFTHKVPMLSIKNAYNAEELGDFMKKFDRTDYPDDPRKLERFLKQYKYDDPFIPKVEFPFIASAKVDGISASLWYKDGKFVRAVTRGDGTVGEEITNNVRTIRNVPLTIPIDKEIEIRGEIYIPKKEFQRINDNIEKMNRENEGNGKKPIPLFANARNLCAGTLKGLDPQVASDRKMRFVAHSVGFGWGSIEYFHEYLEECKKLGFEVVRYIDCRGNKTDYSDVKATVEGIWRDRRDYPYEIDGVVVALDEMFERRVKGENQKCPNWAIACKFFEMSAETTLFGVKFEVAESGKLTPVAYFEPVEIGGAKITKCQLTGKFDMEPGSDTGFTCGDRIIIEKAGGIIPKLKRVVHKNPYGTSYKVPDRCPKCFGELVRKEKKDGSLGKELFCKDCQQGE